MDTKTAMLLWAAEALTLAILLLATWLHDRRQVVTGLWGGGFACHGIGIMLVGLRGAIPDFVSIALGNEIILLGIGLWSLGVLKHDSRQGMLVLLLPGVLWAAALLLPHIYENFWTRTVVVQSCSALSYLLLGYCLLTGPKPVARSRKLFAIVTAVQAGLMLNMALQSSLQRPATFEEMPDLAVYSIGNIFCLVSAILLGARMLMTRSEERLRRIAETDPLTGVLNRRGFLDQFERVRKETHHSRNLLAIVIFDLDHFKQINDQHGHKGGDDVLVHFCGIALSCLRERSVFGRLGGEEFACLFPVSSVGEAVGTAEAIRLTLYSKPLLSQDNKLIHASVSAGIVVAAQREAELDSMLSSADRALYVAKEAGRNGSAVAQMQDIARVTSTHVEAEQRVSSSEATSSRMETRLYA